MAEIPAYSLEQLQDLNLPGYQLPATILEISGPETDWWPVMSLSISREHPLRDGRRQILTGVRHNTTTHDGVVSTPTGQFPKYLQHPLLREWEPLLYGGHDPLSSTEYALDMLGYDAPEIREVGTLAEYHPNQELFPSASLLSVIVLAVMERKLSLPKGLLNAGVRLGTVGLSHVIYGFSYVGDAVDTGEPLYEPLIMYGAVVNLNTAGVELIPPENDKYKHLGWTEDSATFWQDLREKNVFNLAPAAKDAAVGYCARGLCLITTAGVSRRQWEDD